MYAVLHVSPDASDEEIRRAYRHWAQVYHPDKYQAPQVTYSTFDSWCGVPMVEVDRGMLLATVDFSVLLWLVGEDANVASFDSFLIDENVVLELFLRMVETSCLWL